MSPKLILSWPIDVEVLRCTENKDILVQCAKICGAFPVCVDGGASWFRYEKADRQYAADLARLANVPMVATFSPFHNHNLTTGDPSYETLMPNVMLRNAGGKRFQDVTESGGFGHLHCLKISCWDIRQNYSAVHWDRPTIE